VYTLQWGAAKSSAQRIEFTNEFWIERLSDFARVFMQMFI
jgi:hypothetical protein